MFPGRVRQSLKVPIDDTLVPAGIKQAKHKHTTMFRRVHMRWRCVELLSNFGDALGAVIFFIGGVLLLVIAPRWMLLLLLQASIIIGVQKHIQNGVLQSGQ